MDAEGKRDYHLFLLGAALGSVCGLVLGSFAAVRIGVKGARLARQLVDKLLRREKSVHFELLLQ